MLQTRKTTDLIVVHCSATRGSQDLGVKDIDRMHRARGWLMVGYHFVIKRDGTVQLGRPENAVGSHVEGYNSSSIGICMIGGVDEDGKTAKNTFTPAQFDALAETIRVLKLKYRDVKRVCGHRDLSKDLNRDGKITPNEWSKQCPSFDVAKFLSAHEL